jgi:hypothetical protein
MLERVGGDQGSQPFGREANLQFRIAGSGPHYWTFPLQETMESLC